MRFATTQDIKAIMNLFKLRKDIFPHIRQDAIMRRIKAQECIWEYGVCITFQEYKKDVTLGTVTIPKGSVMLHQIVATTQGDGSARAVFKEFVYMVAVKYSGDLYLAVRANNGRARAFYKKMGMKLTGEIAWASGTMLGVLYRLCPKRMR